MHLVGLIVAGERVHDDVNAGAIGKLLCSSPPGTAANMGRSLSSSAQAAARSFEVTMIELTPSDLTPRLA